MSSHGPIYVTEEGLGRLRNSLAELEQKLTEVSKQMAEAAEVGGNVWHDNPAFEAIEQSQRSLMRDIDETREKLSRAVVIEKPTAHNKTVVIGSTVEIVFDSGEKRKIKIGDYTEADPAQGVISYKSPLGNALLGAKTGERRKYQVEDRTVGVTIRTISLTK